MEKLWTETGLEEIETTSFQVKRTFSDFDEYWTVNCHAPSVANYMKDLPHSILDKIKYDLEIVPKRDGENRIASVASANAVKGIKN